MKLCPSDILKQIQVVGAHNFDPSARESQVFNSGIRENIKWEERLGLLGRPSLLSLQSLTLGGS